MNPDEQGAGKPCEHPDPQVSEPRVLEEIEIEDLAVDGICGVY